VQSACLSQKALHDSKGLQDQIWGLVMDQKCCNTRTNF